LQRAAVGCRGDGFHTAPAFASSLDDHPKQSEALFPAALDRADVEPVEYQPASTATPSWELRTSSSELHIWAEGEVLQPAVTFWHRDLARTYPLVAADVILPSVGFVFPQYFVAPTE
jgi:hypothetical protein